MIPPWNIKGGINQRTVKNIGPQAIGPFGRGHPIVFLDRVLAAPHIVLRSVQHILGFGGRSHQFTGQVGRHAPHNIGSVTVQFVDHGIHVHKIKGIEHPIAGIEGIKGPNLGHGNKSSVKNSNSKTLTAVAHIV